MVGACRSRSKTTSRPRPGPAPPPAPGSSPGRSVAGATPLLGWPGRRTRSMPNPRRERRLCLSLEPQFSGELGPPGVLLPLQLAEIDGGGGQVGVIERRLHRFQRRLHPTQRPGVAVAQSVQRPLQWDPGQLGRLAQLLADVLAVYRLVSPAARGDGLLPPPPPARRFGGGQERP